MAVQTYCDQDDVEDILSDAGVQAFLDDDEGGTVSAAELLRLTAMIERAAIRMNARLEQRYTLSSLASNDWCKYANATMAAYNLMQRRGNPVPEGLAAQTAEILEFLEDVQAFRARIPGATPRVNATPTVSNYHVERYQSDTPVRVRSQPTTGHEPTTPVKRPRADYPGRRT